MRLSILAMAVALVLSACETEEESQKDQVVMASQKMFIGTYTKKEGHVDGKGEGIYFAKTDDSGKLRTIQTSFQSVNPSFVAVRGKGRDLLSVSEIGGEDGMGRIFWHEITEDHSLVRRDDVATNGMYPCHITTNHQGTLVFVSNYVGGVVDVFNAESGRLYPVDTLVHKGSSDHPRQDGSHPHQVVISPDDRFVYIQDLGANKIWVYKVDNDGKALSPSEVQPFVEMDKYAGPRHMALHPLFGYAYVINELNNTISVMWRNVSDGVLTQVQVISSLPPGFSGANSAADIHVHPEGKFLYVSNRGDNSIGIYAIDPSNGQLSYIGHEPTRGDHPRNFAIDKNGRNMYVANQNSDNVVRFAINPETGKLTFVDETSVRTPVCLALFD